MKAQTPMAAARQKEVGTLGHELAMRTVSSVGRA